MATKKNNDYITIRLDNVLKADFETFCGKCGMTVSGAVNLLVKRTVREHKVPFIISSASDGVGMSKERERQSERISVRIEKEFREEFAEVCNSIGIPMSRIVKIFMTSCINNGKLPF